VGARNRVAAVRAGLSPASGLGAIHLDGCGADPGSSYGAVTLTCADSPVFPPRVQTANTLYVSPEPHWRFDHPMFSHPEALAGAVPECLGGPFPLRHISQMALG